VRFLLPDSSIISSWLAVVGCTTHIHLLKPLSHWKVSFESLKSRDWSCVHFARGPVQKSTFETDLHKMKCSILWISFESRLWWYEAICKVHAGGIRDFWFLKATCEINFPVWQGPHTLTVCPQFNQSGDLLNPSWP